MRRNTCYVTGLRRITTPPYTVCLQVWALQASPSVVRHYRRPRVSYRPLNKLSTQGRKVHYNAQHTECIQSSPHVQSISQYFYTNDPSAGSPTETLLRLLLPLSDKVYTTLYCNARRPTIAQVWIIYRITRSVGATGGVYKGQGRNQHEMMTHTY